jgi:Domain of unknown function (DUF4352)
MPEKRLKLVIVSVLCVVMMLLLAACNDPTTTSESGTVPPQAKPNTPVPTTAVTANATVVTSAGNGPNVTPPPGPEVISSPTPIPGGSSKSQQVVLQDRTLLITDVSQQKGADPTAVSVILTLTVKNTSSQAIQNQPDFYQLVGAEGDSFGKQSNSSDAFYGPISANSQHSGTIVFQIPSAAIAGLRLMYRPENPSETVFTPLNF